MLVTPTPPNLAAQRFGMGSELFGQAGLPDARLPGEHDYLTPASLGVVESIYQRRQITLSADELLPRLIHHGDYQPTEETNADILHTSGFGQSIIQRR